MYAGVDVVASLSGVEQEARELEAEVHVVRAAAPAPIRQGGRRARVRHVAPGVASARLELALSARLGNGVSDAGRGNRISKRRLSITCEKCITRRLLVNKNETARNLISRPLLFSRTAGRIDWCT